MIAFLVDGVWCKPTADDSNPPIVANKADSWWRDGNWNALGCLNVEHPVFGVIQIVPRSFAARIQESD